MNGQQGRCFAYWLLSSPPSLQVGPPSSAWVKDVTQDGDVEANPGPETAMPIDSPTTFQMLAPQFCHPPDAYSPKTVQTQDGKWFEVRPLPPSSLLFIAESVLLQPPDNFFSGDGLEIPTIPDSVRVFDLADQHLLNADAMKGTHSFIFLPRPLPFTDTPAVYSLRTWANTIREAMQQDTTNPTLVTLVLQSRFDSPTPTTLPLLDRRFELDIIRRNLTAIRIVPDLCLLHRDGEGAVLSDRLPTPAPLMMFFYSSSSSFSSQVSTEVWSDQPTSPAPQPPDADHVIHVILNIAATAQAPAPLCGLRILMVLNGMDPNDTSTNLRNASGLAYPPDFIPITRKASPATHTIADYHVPPFIVERLSENSRNLTEYGVDWAILNEPLGGSFTVNHQPRKFQPGKPTKKRPSPEVRDSLLVVPAIAGLLDSVILLNKWDVWIRPHAGVDVALLAAQLQNLDDLAITDAAQLMRVRLPTGPLSVSPPDVLASFPARILPTTVIAEISQLVPVLSHQPTHRPGLLLLQVGSREIATLLYGAKVPTRQGFITLTTGTDTGDTQWETSHGLSRGASLLDRQPLLSALAGSSRPLTADALSGLQASMNRDSGNGW